MNILSFIKFGSEENIRSLYEDGTIYCNPLETFRKMEDNYLRGDSYEGSTNILNYPSNSKIELRFENGKSLELKTARIRAREHLTEIKGNVYCLTAITREEIVKEKKLKLDNRFKEFGSHFIIIKDNKKFFELLKNSFIEANYKIKTGFVNYYDKLNYFGKVDFFHKPNEFSFQKEFRILINNDKIEPIVIHLGSLKEIAEVYETIHLDELEFRHEG